MKKYRSLKIFAVILLVGVLVTPYLYDRLHSVDPLEAARLAQLPTEDVGPTLAHCMNAKSQRVWVPWQRDYDRHEARPDFATVLNGEYYYLPGMMGWNVTWAVLVPLNADPVAAYDTFGAKGTDAPLFREDLPWEVIRRLRQCGAEYGGVWPAELPHI